MVDSNDKYGTLQIDCQHWLAKAEKPHSGISYRIKFESKIPVRLGGALKAALERLNGYAIHDNRILLF